jgi:DNA-binding MarR family transcriptional regulator
MTMHERMHRRNPDAPHNRDNILKRRNERRALVIEYLDHADRPRAVGMRAKTIAERTGLVAQSVMMTLFSLVKHGIAIKKPDAHGVPTYFLAPKKAITLASGSGQAAIELYRAEKARRDEARQQVLAEAKADLERLERTVNAATAAKSKRGAQRAGETTRRKAAERRRGIAVGWKDASY